MTPQENNFKTLLGLYRKIMSPAQRKRTRNLKRRAFPYPLGIEREYARNISRLTLYFIEATQSELSFFLDAHIRNDSVDTDLDLLMSRIQEEFLFIYGTDVVSSGNLGVLLNRIAENILGLNSSFLQKQLTIISGVPLTIDKPWWPEVKAIWEQENYKLIKNLGAEYVTKINSIIINGVQNGFSQEQIAGSIKNITVQLTGYRARMIARDQVGKLNSLITKNQALSIGMETYWWQTAHDEKVRGDPSGPYKKAIPSHYVMSDLLLAWGNPTVYSGDLGKTWKPKTGLMETLAPGMAILCRCTVAFSWHTYLTKIDEGDLI